MALRQEGKVVSAFVSGLDIWMSFHQISDPTLTAVAFLAYHVSNVAIFVFSINATIFFCDIGATTSSYACENFRHGARR